ncbi:MAG: prepilin peptidase [Bauldia sp.]|nr:prepilin peptidase [Bauldia sp.]
MVLANLIGYAAFLAFPLAMLYAALSDLLTMTIANRISLFLAAAFVAAAFLVGMDLSTIGFHVLAGAVVLLAGFGLFAAGWIGGGDAKVASAAALWLGWGGLGEFLVLSSIFGAVLAIVLLNFRKVVLPVAVVRQEWVARLHHPETGIPYGIALAVAALAAYPHSVWLGLVS